LALWGQRGNPYRDEGDGTQKRFERDRRVKHEQTEKRKRGGHDCGKPIDQVRHQRSIQNLYV
jgi:hypothetical protein